MADLFTRLAESPTALLPSGNPLELLPTRQFLILVGKAARRSMTELAAALHISRETAYQDLRAATAVLARVRPGWRRHARRCMRCRREPRLPGRRIGRRCRYAQDAAIRRRRLSTDTRVDTPGRR